MIGFDVDDYWIDAPGIAKGNYNLWRLMIDYNGPHVKTSNEDLMVNNRS